ncbi:MAG: hypothetical protein WDM88_03185 [Galbitalea sp.]
MLDLMSSWRELGGRFEFGDRAETSCFFMARDGDRDQRSTGIWPITVYPKTGSVEVVFQWLKDRPPFDRVGLREELRTRLNRIAGIEIAEDRLAKRPSFNSMSSSPIPTGQRCSKCSSSL